MPNDNALLLQHIVSRVDSIDSRLRKIENQWAWVVGVSAACGSIASLALTFYLKTR